MTDDRTLARYSVVTMVLALGAAMSADAYETTVTISGTVLASIPCVINNERPIVAAFGDVQIADIDGSYKTITLDYTLDCARAVTNEVRMQVRGTGTWFSPALLAVPGNNELGIAFKKDGAALAVNTWANFDAGKKPLIQAVLAKRSQSSEIVNGAFSASATMVVEYR
ncbi:fimbrial protein [Pseudomonas gessardii]|uniref:Fimbrial protein n=2 Tax=Pseudomonas gessardii TaxID=78544 RepID=A0ABS9F9U9_9PSED|nr:fimbrial protein [Pseudomonas gessardii]MBH3423985.1 fimbrial protein [Pseudomonas gessardii]MCF4982134.1 fimbrial protein [Pseudomonas gessardii]MCF5088155.1 fimbrial protein [Pseudomonas gessardii]MCF5098960.1 fimbrial protein [Pseudomonas gessardii]MCF5109124.1 fimbrial protein [Pseudomonas gessardii]